MPTREQLLELDLEPQGPKKPRGIDERSALNAFAHDEDLPVLGLDEMEGELAWMDEKLSIDENGRFCGKRYTGEVIADAEADAIVDEDEMRHPAWGKE